MADNPIPFTTEDVRRWLREHGRDVKPDAAIKLRDLERIARELRK